jgi:hypothetical protein
MMSALVRGCGEFLVVWLLATGTLFYVFYARFAPPGPAWAGVLGGFFVASAWGLSRNAYLARSQVSLIQSSAQGAKPFGDRLYAAVGTAVASEKPLVSPFLQQPCVLYSYELSETRVVRVRSSKGSRNEKKRTVYFSGLAMTDWAVQTPSGPVRVCSFPVPDRFEEQVIDGDRMFPQVVDFCLQTEFTQVGKWEVGKMVSFAAIPFRESGGPVQQHLWFDGADDIMKERDAFRRCRLIEQMIPTDQPVCVIGKYDADRKGLINDLSSGGLQVLPGSAADAMRQLRSTANAYFLFAAIAFLIGTLGSFGILSLRKQRTMAEQPTVDRDQELLAAFEAENWQQVSDLLADGASTDVRDSSGRTLLLAAIDRNRAIAIELLLEAGANPSLGQTGWKRSPIEAAFDRGQADLVQRFLDLGASGMLVDRDSGQPLTDETGDLESLLDKYTRALDEPNRALLETICDDWPDDYFAGVSRGLYKDTRPLTWKVVEGYRRDDVVCCIARGQTRRGVMERYVVTAVQRNGGWKLKRVYWDEFSKFSFKEP